MDPQAWDNLVALSPQGHFLQSYRWGQFKRYFGWEVARVVVGEAGAQLLFRHTPLGTVAYIPRGPFLTNPTQALTPLLEAIHQRARGREAIFLKVEPNAPMAEDLPGEGFHPSPQTIQPKASLVVDLTPDLKEISARQKPKTRYNIGLAARRGLEVWQAGQEELPHFFKLMKVTGRRDGFAIRPLIYFQRMFQTLGEQVQLFLAGYQGEVLAGIVLGSFGAEAIYLYGASGDEHRNLMPNHLLQWEAMKWAKARGLMRYDMWGVPSEAETGGADPSDPAQGLWGVYRFKEGFGGRLLSLPGAFDYPYSPGRYRLWTGLVPRLQRLRRRR